MSLLSVQIDAAGTRYHARSGKRHSLGKTAGEALDSLLAQEAQGADSSAILIQRFVPDRHFSQAQYERLKNLLDRRSSLTAKECAELDELIDAELDATVKRTDFLLQNGKS